MALQPKTTLETVLDALGRRRFSLHDEKVLQVEIMQLLQALNVKVEREHRLGARDIIDFLIDGEIGIEVKIKGAKRDIYRQCERYCKYNRIKVLILFTNVSMGFPPEINGKDCYLFKPSNAWL